MSPRLRFKQKFRNDGCFDLILNRKSLDCPCCKAKIAAFSTQHRNFRMEKKPNGVPGEMHYVWDFDEMRLIFLCGSVFRFFLAPDKTIHHASDFMVPCPGMSDRLKQHYNPPGVLA